MANRKSEERNIRSLQKTAGGSSYALTIPREYIVKLGWRAKQKLDVKLVGDKIVIADWKK